MKDKQIIPINYQYPLSAAIYKIIENADGEYAHFLHEHGYGKGFKHFTFSDISCPFRIKEDRLLLQSPTLSFQIAFYMPKASQSFVQGLFMSQQIDIADKKSKAQFSVQSVELLSNPLDEFDDEEIITGLVKPISPIVCGTKNEAGHYDFSNPEVAEFSENLIFNWREKIKTQYDEATAEGADLNITISFYKNHPKSRLVTIKSGSKEETKIRGFMNFKMEIRAEKRFVELAMNSGFGLYNAVGMGCVDLCE